MAKKLLEVMRVMKNKIHPIKNNLCPQLYSISGAIPVHY